MGKPFLSDYGSMRDRWGVTHCRGLHPQLQMSIWCCQAWCYVDEMCPSAIPSLISFGYLWSDQACPDNGNLLASCSYSNVGRPTGGNTGLNHRWNMSCSPIAVLTVSATTRCAS